LTFLAAGVLAYALNPLVRRLERWRVPRALAVVGVFLVLIFVVVAGLLVVIVPAVGQVQSLIQDPQAIARQANGLVEQTQGLPYVGEYVVELDQDRALQLLRSNAPSPGQVVGVATGVLDRERITRGVHNAIPEMVHDQVFELFYAVEQALIKYLRGQFLLCAIMGVIGWAIGFFAIGEYALLVGVWVAITEIIPVLGAFLGAVPAVAIALFVPDGGFTTALIVAGLFLVAQQIEGNILVPRIQGGSVGVHPLWVLFATLAGTALYGIVGAIFAVPIVAIVAATLRYMRRTLLFERWANAPLRPADGKPEELEADSPSAAAGVHRTRLDGRERKP
jgi:predicted PurR-regulated permease PerM